jgi:hypothetical protein
MLISGVQANNAIDIRFSTPIIDQNTNTAYVNIQLKSTDDALVLAGQNYRIFYNTDVLTLNEELSNTNLPQGKYTDIIFTNTIENVKAAGVGSLEFDDNMGFSNFSIDLLDQVDGGVTVSSGDEWTTVATLNFSITADIDDMQLVWGRQDRSEDYATAFVEMAEWVSPKKIASLDINEYHDLEFTYEEAEALDIVSFEFGPNPTTEFVNISFGQALQSNAELRFINMKGQVSKRVDIDAGSTNTQIFMTDVPAGNYIIEVKDETNSAVAPNRLSVLK